MPTFSHAANRNQEVGGRYTIRNRHPATPRTGNTNPRGTRKGRGLEGSFTRRMITPRHTRMKANSVPMLVRSTISSRLVNSENTPTPTPVKIVEPQGVRYFG